MVSEVKIANTENVLMLYEAKKMPKDVILLDVGGSHFETSKSTLMKSPYLSFVLSKEDDLKDKPLFIDRDGTNFRIILNFLRDGAQVQLPSDEYALREIQSEAKFYQLQDLYALAESKIGISRDFSDRHLAQSKCLPSRPAASWEGIRVKIKPVVALQDLELANQLYALSIGTKDVAKCRECRRLVVPFSKENGPLGPGLALGLGTSPQTSTSNGTPAKDYAGGVIEDSDKFTRIKDSLKTLRGTVLRDIDGVCLEVLWDNYGQHHLPAYLLDRPYWFSSYLGW